MKLLFLPNEYDENNTRFRQIAPRKAFARLRALGRIEELEIFSYLHVKALRGAEVAKSELLSKAEAFRPNVIFWQHVGGFPIDDSYVAELKRRSGCDVLAYHDEDPFDPFIKRIDRSMQVVLRASDLVLISGTGRLFALYRANGAKNVSYIPHYYDDVRFGQPWTPTLKRDHKITMIAGRYILRRIPFLYMPGGSRRAKLARRLSAIYGKEFALYGPGWDGLASWRGVLPFLEQTTTIRNGWISVNWDQFDYIPFYCSDRLPISMAAGVPHVTSYHAGYEYMLSGAPGVYWGKSAEEVVAVVEWLLSRPKEELIEEGQAAQVWVKENWEADVVFERAFDICLETIERKMQR